MRAARDARAWSAEELEVSVRRAVDHLEVSVRRAVHRQEKVGQERLRRDQRVVPSHPLRPERRLELPFDAVGVVPRRRAFSITIGPPMMTRIEEHVPQSAERRERIIRPAVAFMVPVVMMRHLGER